MVVANIVKDVFLLNRDLIDTYRHMELEDIISDWSESLNGLVYPTRLLKERLSGLESEAQNAQKIAHYIADKAIKDAVDRLVEKICSSTPQSLGVLKLSLTSEGSEGIEERKEFEVRLKTEMGLGALGGDEDFKNPSEEALESYKRETERLALEYAMEDATKMIKAYFGVQTEE